MQGDPDDTSHRGHPLCKFCDERYLDNDELLKHLRRDHYFCHFCDSDGAQDYYRWARPGRRRGGGGGRGLLLTPRPRQRLRLPARALPGEALPV